MAVKKPIAIVGCGPGAREYLTRDAELAVAGAEVLAGPERLLALFPGLDCERVVWRGKSGFLIDAVGNALGLGKRIVVLVSGDVGLFSLASRLVEAFGRENCRLHPGISAFQLAFARLGEPWDNARFIHAHGDVPAIDPAGLSGEERIAVALDSEKGWEWFVAAVGKLFATHKAYICGNLSLDDEEITEINDIAALSAGSPPRLAIGVMVRSGVLHIGRSNHRMSNLQKSRPLRHRRF